MNYSNEDEQGSDYTQAEGSTPIKSAERDSVFTRKNINDEERNIKDDSRVNKQQATRGSLLIDGIRGLLDG